MNPLLAVAASAAFKGEVGFGGIKRIILLVVDSHSSPKTDWDMKEEPPGFAVQLMQSAGVPIDRFSFETIETMKDQVQIMTWRRELQVAKARLAGASEAEAEARLPKVSLNVLNVSFDAIRDPKERAYFMELPTSFVLPPEEVDRLRDMAGQLMRESEDYEKIVQSLGGGVTK